MRLQSTMLWAFAHALRTTARFMKRGSHHMHVRADRLILRANALDEANGSDHVAESASIVIANLERARKARGP